MGPGDDTGEQALVRRANAGDGAALEALYAAHRDWVVGLARRFTASRDDALDVLQETFLYFFGRFPGFVLSSTVRSYLYPVVKNHSIDLLRRRRKVVDLDAYRAGRGGEEELRWEPNQEAGDLERLVASLPGEQQEVVRLRYALDFRLEEIADALRIPLGTVKSRLHNALRSLKEEVDRENRRGA